MALNGKAFELASRSIGFELYRDEDANIEEKLPIFSSSGSRRCWSDIDLVAPTDSNQNLDGFDSAYKDKEEDEVSADVKADRDEVSDGERNVTCCEEKANNRKRKLQAIGDVENICKDFGNIATVVKRSKADVSDLGTDVLLETPITRRADGTFMQMCVDLKLHPRVAQLRDRRGNDTPRRGAFH